MNDLYFDYAAATPMDKQVRAAMEPFYADFFYNPSALYSGARSVLDQLAFARSRVAQTIGSRPAEIIFTAGGSESTNLAIKGVMDRFPAKEILISAIEHEAVRKPAQHYAHKLIPVNADGIVNLEALKQSISEDTVLLSIILVNNEIGTLQPIHDIVVLADQIRKDRKRNGNKTTLYVHTDACQAPLYLDCNVARLGVDLMSLNGGKIYGPKQSGILYVRAGLELQPQIEGGGQEFGLRSGTENVAFAVGFTTALELAHSGRHERTRQVTELRDYLIRRLLDDCGAELTGHPTKRIANNVHVTFAGKDNERIIFALDELGVAVASGSACSASSDEPSVVLKALGFSDERARSSIRFSLGKYNSKESIDVAIEKLRVALNS